MKRQPLPMRRGPQPVARIGDFHYVRRLVEVAHYRESEVLSWLERAKMARGAGREECAEQLRRLVARPPEGVWLRAVVGFLELVNRCGRCKGRGSLELAGGEKAICLACGGRGRS